jgi:hypothetical protein
MRWLTFLLVAGLLCGAAPLSSGCAGHVPPNAAPEVKIAIYAADAMTGVREVQRMTAALEDAKIISEPQAAKVMEVALKIGQGGEKLSKALALYHGASDLVAKKLALAEVLATLDDMSDNLDQLLAPLDPTGAKLKYIDTVVEIIKSLFSIRALLPAMGGA